MSSTDADRIRQLIQLRLLHGRQYVTDSQWKLRRPDAGKEYRNYVIYNTRTESVFHLNKLVGKGLDRALRIIGVEEPHGSDE